jgi:hypothetical protein
MRSAWLAAPAAAALAVGFALAGPVERAEARPAYSQREGKDCAFCHVNPRGGGPRNAKGEEYQKNGLTFSVAKGFGEDRAFTTEANGKTFSLVRVAIGLGHFKYALAKLKSLDGKEKSTAGKQLVLNTFPVVDGRGRDLLKVAKDAVTNGMVKDAAESLARVESEFAGREPAKEVGKVREGLQKLPGGPEAYKAAVAMQPQRLQYLDALMKVEEGDVTSGVKLLTDFTTKFPDSPFTAEAKAKIEECQKPKGG